MEDNYKWEEIISSKFDEPKFPFDEENWEKAEAMLDKRLRREKFRRIFFIYFSGLLTGLLLMFFGLRYFSNDNSQQPKTGLIASNESSRAADQNNSSAPASSNLTAPHTTDEDGDNQKARQSDQPQNNNVDYTAANNADQPSGKVSADDASTVPTNSGNHTAGSGSDQSNSQNGNSNAHSSSDANSNANAQHTNDHANNDQSHVAASDQHANDASTVASSDVNAQSSSNSNEAALQLPAAGNVSEQTVIEANSNGTAVQSDVPVNADVDSAFAAKVDSMYAKHSGFSLEAGSNFNMGWRYGDSAVEGRGFNPVAGVAYTAHFGPDWTLRTSIRYENYRHFKVSRLETTDRTPGFGKNNVDTAIIPHSLHYISVPLIFERRISPRSFIGIGASYSYLFTTRSRTEVWREKNGDDLQEIIPGTAYGYMGGFNAWDIELNLAYQHQLSTHFGMRLEGSYGLREFKENTLYATPESKMDRVFAFRFMLTYNFGKQ